MKTKKKCSRCKQLKSLKDFYKNKSMKDGLRHYCKDCGKIEHQKLHEYYHGYYLQRNHDINEEQYQDLLNVQNNCCVMCGKHNSKLREKLHVDHDHKTGIIRGLLCSKCNQGLGHYEKYKKQSKKYLQSVPQRMIKFYKKWLKQA